MAGNFAAGSFDLDKFLEKHKLEDIIDLTGEMRCSFSEPYTSIVVRIPDI